jgi:hypothetical protein
MSTFGGNLLLVKLNIYDDKRQDEVTVRGDGKYFLFY